jgi:hypothetical protein
MSGREKVTATWTTVWDGKSAQLGGFNYDCYEAHCTTGNDCLYYGCKRDVDLRLAEALRDAGRSALGMPASVDTLRAMLDRAGLALVLSQPGQGGGRDRG